MLSPITLDLSDSSEDEDLELYKNSAVCSTQQRRAVEEQKGGKQQQNAAHHGKMQTGSTQQQNLKRRKEHVEASVSETTVSVKGPKTSSTPYPHQSKKARKGTQTAATKSSPVNVVTSTQFRGKIDLHLSVSLLPDTVESDSISLSQKVSKSPRKFGIGRGSPSKRLSKNSPLRYFRQPPLTSFFNSKGPRRALFDSPQKDGKATFESKKTEHNEKEERDSSDSKTDTSSSSVSLSSEETNETGTSKEQRTLATAVLDIKEISNSSPLTATDRALDQVLSCPSGDLYTDKLVGVLAPILRHPHTAPLLSNEEWRMVVCYLLLPPSSRTAVTRLLARQPGWHRLSALERYGSVSELQERFEAPQEDGFVSLECSSESASVLLPLLKMPEIKSLCSEFNIATAAKNKPQLINDLLKLQARQKGVTGKSVPLVSRIVRALGPCVKASDSLRSLLSRLFLITSLGCASAPEDRTLASMVFRVTNVETGRVIYPNCEVIRKSVIFPTREHLLRYETAIELQNESMVAIEKKDWATAREIVAVIENNFRELLTDANEREHVEQLPSFLRRFTPGTVYASCLQYGAEVYRKSGKEHYKSAVQILELILSQKLYRTHRRGKCYVALALLLHRHVRDHAAAAEVVIRGLSEPVPECCTAAEQLSLVRRAVLIADYRSSTLPADVKRRLRLAILNPQPVMKIPATSVKARQLGGQRGYKGIYIRDDHTTNEKHFSSVEEIAIAHYRTEGYTEGLHCEGSVVTSLFALLFWDILYDTPVPDAFLSPYQTAPLDLGTEYFYSSRQDFVERRLADIRAWDQPHLQRFVGERYEEHRDKLCLVSWNYFCSVNKLTGLVRCMGGQLLAVVCERLVKNFHSCRRGFPDLVLWMPASGKCKIVEVKGPNDRLSPDQEVWLDFLFRAGADVEICHVETTGSKKLQKKTVISDDNSDSETA
ncbi:fanconi-associated nuclease 1-like isoform X1 [Schistocerca serialis cubense]|uniref:fanconi-associated nuclease 1-like isoform X1 n=1 Tax=Schistocerca serialis cubense TaxID=2023355 RepID=UPI00214F3F71|nr:fanconi-associated nuclease 1-like isoform X1 [Schistocerca serialis cubense]